MHYKSVSLVVASLLFTAPVGAVQQKPEEQIRGYVLQFADKFSQARDPRELAAFYSVDATHINPQGEWVRGREELVAYFAPVVAQRSSNFSAEFDIERVELLTDQVAVVDGSIVISGRRGPDGTEIPRVFERFTLVMEKSGDEWSIAASRVMFPEER